MVMYRFGLTPLAERTAKAAVKVLSALPKHNLLRVN